MNKIVDVMREKPDKNFILQIKIIRKEHHAQVFFRKGGNSVNEMSGLKLYVVKKEQCFIVIQYIRAASETNCSSSKEED
ncbi:MULTISPECIES: hypothetical protein [Bacillus]|uniref:hypothetical protein n=1 Tax=Bacillus TaxID=1386 RepID=UPI000B5D9472|nr:MULTISPECIES: hypothetical protein [Bacillus]OXB99581.1 hypothetical protein CGQ22_08175 [Bacillus sp. M13(2017)]QCY61494.1 hypothetical protein FHE73_12090 [Bacillus thuringiensis]